MRFSMPKSKRFVALVLVLCLCAVFLIPTGFVLSNINHAHTCCSGEYQADARADINVGMCCTICKDIYNAKNLISSSSASGSSVFSILLLLLALHSILMHVIPHAGVSSLISLKVRLNN